MTEFWGEDYKLVLDENRGCIVSLIQGEKEYIKHETPLFTVRMMNKSGDYEEVSAFDMSFDKKVCENGGYTFVYGSEKVIVSVKIKNDTGINLQFFVKNLTCCAIESVDTSVIVPRDLVKNGGNAKIMWGFNEGTLIEDAAQKEKTYGNIKLEYPGQGLMSIFPAIVETQFMAYFDGVHGLYMGTHDRHGNMKGIDFFDRGNGIELWFRLYSGTRDGEDFDMGYPFVMQMFTGDWYNAAEIYRIWFNANKSPEFKEIDENENIPDWYRESPIVVTYPVRGEHDTDEMKPNSMFPYINAMKVIDEIADKTESKIMALLMHWEGTAPWAPPYVWPPYGGETELKKFIGALHKKGHVIGLYCSGLGYTIQSNLDDYNCEKQYLEQDLEKEMCASPKGIVEKSKICPDQRSGYDMCPAREFTENVIAKEAKSMADCSVDYVQILDQNHGGTAYFCYSREHGHPPVPGKWQVDAVCDILKKINSCTDKKILYGCESAAAETYIPYLLFSDNRFNIVYAIGKPIPVYAYVYHRYVNNFMGNQVYVNNWFDYTRNPENIYMRMANSICAGDMLTVVLNHEGRVIWNWGKQQVDFLPDQDKVLEFARIANKFRTKLAAKYLCTGDMMKPLKIQCGTYDVRERHGYINTFDLVMTSRWRAKDGTWAQIFVNYNDFETDFTVELVEQCIYVTEKEKHECKTGIITKTIAPRSVTMITNDIN